MRINRGKKDRQGVIFLAPIFQSYRLGMFALKVLAINRKHIQNERGLEPKSNEKHKSRYLSISTVTSLIHKNTLLFKNQSVTDFFLSLWIFLHIVFYNFYSILLAFSSSRLLLPYSFFSVQWDFLFPQDLKRGRTLHCMLSVWE